MLCFKVGDKQFPQCLLVEIWKRSLFLPFFFVSLICTGWQQWQVVGQYHLGHPELLEGKLEIFPPAIFAQQRQEGQEWQSVWCRPCAPILFCELISAHTSNTGYSTVSSGEWWWLANKQQYCGVSVFEIELWSEQYCITICNSSMIISGG